MTRNPFSTPRPGLSEIRALSESELKDASMKLVAWTLAQGGISVKGDVIFECKEENRGGAPSGASIDTSLIEFREKIRSVFLDPGWIGIESHQRDARVILRDAFDRLSIFPAPRAYLDRTTIDDQIVASILTTPHVASSVRLTLFSRMLEFGCSLSPTAARVFDLLVQRTPPDRSELNPETQAARESVSQLLRLAGMRYNDRQPPLEPHQITWQVCNALMGIAEVQHIVRQLNPELDRHVPPMPVSLAHYRSDRASLFIDIFSRAIRGAGTEGFQTGPAPEMKPFARADRPTHHEQEIWHHERNSQLLANPALRQLFAREFSIQVDDLRPRERYYLLSTLAAESGRGGAELQTFLRAHGTTGAKTLCVAEYGSTVVKSLLELARKLPPADFSALIEEYAQASNAIDSSMTAFRFAVSRGSRLQPIEERLQQHIHESLMRGLSNVLLSPYFFALHPESVRNHPERFSLHDAVMALRGIRTAFSILADRTGQEFRTTAFRGDSTLDLLATRTGDAGESQYHLAMLVRDKPEILRGKGREERMLEPRFQIMLHFKSPRRLTYSDGEVVRDRRLGPAFREDEPLSAAFAQRTEFYDLKTKDKRILTRAHEESVLRIGLDLTTYGADSAISLDFGRGDYNEEFSSHSKTGDVVGRLQRLKNQGSGDYLGGNHYTHSFESSPEMIETFSQLLKKMNGYLRRQAIHAATRGEIGVQEKIV